MLRRCHLVITGEKQCQPISGLSDQGTSRQAINPGLQRWDRLWNEEFPPGRYWACVRLLIAMTRQIDQKGLDTVIPVCTGQSVRLERAKPCTLRETYYVDCPDYRKEHPKSCPDQPLMVRAKGNLSVKSGTRYCACQEFKKSNDRKMQYLSSWKKELLYILHARRIITDVNNCGLYKLIELNFSKRIETKN